MAPQELIQLYTPETVAQALNIAIAAAYTTTAIITLRVTAYQAGWAITTSVVNAGIGAAVDALQLGNTCGKYNQYAQLAVGYALMIAGLALMSHGYRSAAAGNAGGGDNENYDSLLKESKEEQNGVSSSSSREVVQRKSEGSQNFEEENIQDDTPISSVDVAKLEPKDYDNAYASLAKLVLLRKKMVEKGFIYHMGSTDPIKGQEEIMENSKEFEYSSKIMGKFYAAAKGENIDGEFVKSYRQMVSKNRQGFGFFADHYSGDNLGEAC